MIRARTIFSSLFALGILTVASAAAFHPTTVRSKLERMAVTAKTPAEHLEVAKLYRLQAEQFEKKALKHQAAAQRLESAHNPMAFKWPSLVGEPWVKERRLAMEARRAAKECLEAAERHVRLSAEQPQNADTPVRRSDERRSVPERAGN